MLTPVVSLLMLTTLFQVSSGLCDPYGDWKHHDNGNTTHFILVVRNHSAVSWNYAHKKCPDFAELLSTKNLTDDTVKHLVHNHTVRVKNPIHDTYWIRDDSPEGHSTCASGKFPILNISSTNVPHDDCVDESHNVHNHICYVNLKKCHTRGHHSKHEDPTNIASFIVTLYTDISKPSAKTSSTESEYRVIIRPHRST